MFILQKKLQLLNTKLKEWNISTFQNVHDNVKTAEENLIRIHKDIEVDDHTESLSILEKKSQVQLDDALHFEEIFWKEKAKVKWNMHGDRNTRYFHRIIKIKKTTKRISSLKVEGVVITNQE
ncbi:unnamed protein product [Lathyrus sativus]|nr:unnamed protein product [Lathyrus sativus]